MGTTWSPERARSEAVFNSYATRDGYVVPGSRKKSMKGITATANSPDVDIIGKLDGIRALSRDASMTSPLAISILRRHKIDTVGAGLLLQARINRKILQLAEELASEFEATFESDFDMWSQSLESDFLGNVSYNEQQILAFFNMLLSGDVFFMLPWVDRDDDFPFAMSVHVIDSDLVRNPTDAVYANKDIKGGVEKDAAGRVVAYHVWNTYPDEFFNAEGKTAKSTRVAIKDASGKRQIWHLFDPERLNMRRGVSLLAPVADSLKQLTRLSDAEVMSALIKSFFTVMIKDATGMNALLNGGLPPIDAEYGGGVADPNAVPDARTEDDGNDVEMGHGNVLFLDGQKDVVIADAAKTDANFPALWEALSAVVCSGANMPVEKATMKYNTSFVAAKAAANDAWNAAVYYRALLGRRMNNVVYKEFLTEGALRNRYQLPGFFDDAGLRFAWCGSTWVGSGQGYLNPVQEAKGSVLNLNSFLTTHEDEYMKYHGGRWDGAMARRAREDLTLEANGLVNEPAPEEIVGPDGQQNEEETDVPADNS